MNHLKLHNTWVKSGRVGVVFHPVVSEYQLDLEDKSVVSIQAVEARWSDMNCPVVYPQVFV